jgi:hypothetical protein
MGSGGFFDRAVDLGEGAAAGHRDRETARRAAVQEHHDRLPGRGAGGALRIGEPDREVHRERGGAEGARVLE